MESLQDSVMVLPGVGPKRLTALNQLGINTIYDLLFYFPFRYEDLSVKDLANVTDQEKVTLKGTVVADAVIARFGAHKIRVNVRLLIGHDVIMVTFFNQPWLKDKFHTGDEVAVYGKWDAKRHSLTGMKLIATQARAHQNEYEPIYTVNKAIRQQTLVQLIKSAYLKYHALLKDIIPQTLRQRYRLMDVQQLVRAMHFPKSLQEAKLAHRSAVFREFFLFQLRIQYLKRHNETAQKGLQLNYDLPAVKAFIHHLPFELTHAQKRVVNEICHDMHRPYHMNRLLQGDVGSGKTVVAAIAMFAAVTAGYQAALMVPTEVLAEQHWQNLSKLFAPEHVTVQLLTGTVTGKQRQTALHNIASGRANIIVGTHALIQDAVTFHKLGLVVIDEQHRFGVQQRRILREKGTDPDVLMMTATPIPRTLAITTYGEMDVSSIDEMPKGRLPVKTIWIRHNEVPQQLAFIRQQLAAGHQAFVITPLIAESEKLDLQNAETLYQQMQAYFGDQFKVALLHGQMSADEKEKVMQSFVENKVQLLVSTTVVEVGVDVPNATVMMIYDADRFGLAQLHQLRGRAGRGNAQAYCILVADPKNQTGIERMQIMTKTHNGFVLSQKDLEMRGSGDIFGSRQSGLPEFKIGDPVTDINALVTARDAVQAILDTDPHLQQPQHRNMYQYLQHIDLMSGSFD